MASTAYPGARDRGRERCPRDGDRCQTEDCRRGMAVPAAREASRQGDHDRAGQRHAHDEQHRIVGCGRPFARVLHRGQEAEQRGQCERRRDEVAEPRSVEQVDRPQPKVGGDAEGADQVPRAVERLVPSERAAEELRPGADPVPEQADRPHQLIRLAPAEPLVGDERGERERQDRAQEGKDDVQVHETDHLREPSRPGASTKSGAHVRARTGDLFLTKEVLCQLSYVGTRRCVTRGQRAPAVSQDGPILDNRRSTCGNLCTGPRICWPEVFEWEGWWAGRESNPHSRRRLIYSQRSSPPAQPAPVSGADAWWSPTVADRIRPMRSPQPMLGLPRSRASRCPEAGLAHPSASSRSRCPAAIQATSERRGSW